MDIAFDTWLEVLGLKRGEHEDLNKFLLRFDTIVAKLQQSAVPLPNALLSLHLLHSLNVDEMQRRCIITNISLEKESVLDDMKSAVRMLKSSIVERKVENENKDSQCDSQAFYVNSSYPRRRSSSRGREFDYRNQPRNYERDNRRSGSRGRGYDHQSQYGQQYDRRQRSGSRNRSTERNNSNSSERRNSNNRSSYKRNNNRTYETVNITYDGNIERSETILLNLSESQRALTLDTATTKTCVGRKYMNDMVASASNEEKESFEYYKENRSFRFGNGVRYPSKSGIKIPIVLGKFKYDLYASIVDANIPLLVGSPDMKNMGLSINF